MPFRKGYPSANPAGRPKGSQNKVTSDIRAMVDEALSGVGGAAYLIQQARDNPQAFMALVGKCLPKDINVDATVTATHAALCEAAGQVAPEVVRAGIEAMRLKMSESAEVTHRKPAP